MATTDYYSAGVERITDYLRTLPPRAREMWMDAAYGLWLMEQDAEPSNVGVEDVLERHRVTAS
jgi:hypothetical protein